MLEERAEAEASETVEVPKPKAPKPKAAKPPEPPKLEEKKGRGRPKKPTAKISPEEIAKSIEGLHQLAVVFTGDPALGVTHEQAMMIAEPAHAVIDQFDLWWLFGSMPLVELAVAVAMVEGPIVLHLVQSRRRQKGGGDGGRPPVAVVGDHREAGLDALA